MRCLRCLFFFLSQVSLLFEGENLAQASPATVSRCGMVYNDYTDLGWTPYVQSWLDKRHKVSEEISTVALSEVQALGLAADSDHFPAAG